LAIKAATRAPKVVLTFEQAARRWFDETADNLKSAKDQAIWPRRLETYVFPHLGSIPIAEVDANMVADALKPIWADKTETASRLRGKVEAVLSWATVKGMRSGENPARWGGNLEHLLVAPGKIAEVEHHEALPVAELPGFMARLAAHEGRTRQARITKDALVWTILTVARWGETHGAKWSELDMEGAKTWTIPGSRMKAGVEHVIPLPDRLIGDPIYRAMRGDAWGPDHTLFPCSDTAVRRLACKIAGKDITIHGFRSTFRNWCAETGVASELAERALAHTLKSKVEAAYNRTTLIEQRRPLMTAWAKFCYSATPISIPVTGPYLGDSDPRPTPDDGEWDGPERGALL
jgi:integrase